MIYYGKGNNGRAAEARDIFMLTFFLIGINKADLYELEIIDNGYMRR